MTLNEILHYKLDEGSGTTIVDSSGNGNTGTSTSVTYTTAKVGSYSGVFGSGSSIAMPNDIGYTTQFSIFAWFKRIGYPTGGYHIICGGQECEISIPDSSGALRIGIYTSTYGRWVQNYGSGLCDGEWHHIGMVVDGFFKIGYIDGIYQGYQYYKEDTLIYSFSNRKIGQFGSSTSYYANGCIDDFRVYNTALSPYQILWLYSQGAGKFDSIGNRYHSELSHFHYYSPYGNLTKYYRDDGKSINIPNADHLNGLLVSYTMTYTGGNIFCYVDMSNVTDYKIQSGDYLEYDIYWITNEAKISFDFTTNSNNLRDSGCADQNGLSAHPGTDLSAYCYQKWYHRKIGLAGAHIGKTIFYYDIACEQNIGGTYNAIFNNICITNGSGTVRKQIFSNTSPTWSNHLVNSGTLNSGTYTKINYYPTGVGKIGDYSKSFYFNGIDSYLEIPYSSDYNKNTWTISMWIYPYTKNNENGGLLGTRFNLDYTFDMKMCRTYFHGDVGNGSGWISTSLDHTYTTPLLSWTHLVYVITNDNCKIYVNGEIGSTISWGSTSPLLMQPTQVMRIGNCAGSEFFHGIVDDIRIYDGYLNSDDVSLLYNSGNGLNYSLKIRGCEAFHNPFPNYARASIDKTKSVGNMTTFTISTDYKVWRYALSCAGSGSLNYGNKKEWQITGDQTICMWIKPSNLTNRQNPYAKAYGGEGTITLETNGSLSYYYGTNGGNGTPYQCFGSGAGSIVTNVWQWICLVRDLKHMKLYWYVNNKLKASSTAYYSSATAGTNNLYIGAGYEHSFSGLIDDVRLYPIALDESMRNYIYNNGLGTNNPLPLATWYKMTAGSGDRCTDELLDRDGRLYSSPSWFAFKNDYAIDFTGSDDSMWIDDYSKHDGAFTIEFWHEKTDDTAMWRTLFCRDGGSYHYVLYNPYQNSSDLSVYNTRRYGSNFMVPNDNYYHHYVMVYGSSSVLVYIDGVYRGTIASMFSSITYPLSVIGNYAKTGGSQNAGKIANIKIYNKALSSTEIQIMFRKKAKLLWFIGDV